MRLPALKGEGACTRDRSSSPGVFSLQSLISAIQGDIEEAEKGLYFPESSKLKEDNFLQVPKSKIMHGH